MSYYVMAPLPESVATHILELIEAIRKNPRKGVHTQDMVDATVDMSRALLHYFFMQPVEIIQTGPMIQKMIQISIKTGLSIISKASKKAFGGMGETQLLKYADYVEGLIRSE